MISVLTLSNILAVIGILSFISSAVAWYDTKITKRYAAQRDFKEIRHLQEQHSKAIEALQEQDKALTLLLIDYLPKTGESPSQIIKRIQGRD